MDRLLPKALRLGDTIGLVSPSSPSPDLQRIEKAVAYLERLGYRVMPARHFNTHAENRCDLDRQKIQDLHDMFSSNTVRAIFCLRGGSGSSRLLKALDYDIIARNPKILAGYSDITALSLAIYAKTGMVTFSGPMLATELHSPTPFTEENFWKILTSPGKHHEIAAHPDHPMTLFTPGTALGTLLAGNLTVLDGLVGTPFMPSMRESLLLVEDINEEPYRVDRLLAHLDNAYLLDHVSGLLYGQFRRDPLHPDEGGPLLDILEFYARKIKPGSPCAAGFSYGHTDLLLTLPVGAHCRYSVTDKGISISTMAPVTT
ncbi:S66 peptidase family protein [Prosthecochloris sp. CIB 2401]|uniref:S66 peptidase family protein n=1 Tax=Prosthecochloris sp. CIB 2401 TaxID=1868325 RepID=UPI00080AC1A6|nr:LD-carboxypeptidase [Prosthecochloris sp. CIB 2401]ANT63867.1 putative murein peptide carboxypeptidase [Prosthecochloris sp. CIB 2401]